MARTSFNATEWARQGFKNFVVQEYISAPFTTIQNRAQVSNSLKSAMGIERVSITGINLLPKEFGPNGEPVYEASNKDPRFRFVGTWVANFNNSAGNPAHTSALNDFVEVTFYGTGLNFLTDFNSSSHDWRVTVDGGVEGGNINPGPANSGVLGGRQYDPNIVFRAVSGLSLGWHTVKIRAASANGLDIYGFEILNSRSDVLVPVGSAFAGLSKESILNALGSSYDAGVVGTRGARVVKYLKDGLISQAVQEVNPSQQNLTSADHTNEDILRIIHFREFGANRSDDFGNLSTSGNNTAAFTLDDGTTTLIAVNINSSSDAVNFNASGAFFTITFIGTGLDVSSFVSGGSESFTTEIDGEVSVGTTVVTNTIPLHRKLVSGLPYGTHTVRCAVVGVPGSNLRFREFKIYGPKKPSIPEGAVELADYNIMANFAANLTAGVSRVSAGVMRKQNMREFTYVDGTGGTVSWNASLIAATRLSGWTADTDRNGAYFEYTFFGTGFDLRFNGDTNRSANISVLVDGLAFTSANFSGVTCTTAGSGITYGGSSGSFALPATNVLDEQSTTTVEGCSFSANGLPLGIHRVRFTNNTASSFIVLDALDIITPIHINGRSFSTGSLSLRDSRSVTPTIQSELGVDLTKAKAWLVYDQTTNTIVESYNISTVTDVATGISEVYWSRKFKNVPVIVSNSDQGSSRSLPASAGNFNQLKSFVRVLSEADGTGTDTDAQYLCLAAFGELEDEDEE